jgi:hypothetical protein
VPLQEGPETDKALMHLRQIYEPFVSALADRLLMPLPSWLPTPGAQDVWKVTAWGIEAWSVTPDEVDGT